MQSLCACACVRACQGNLQRATVWTLRPTRPHLNPAAWPSHLGPTVRTDANSASRSADPLSIRRAVVQVRSYLYRRRPLAIAQNCIGAKDTAATHSACQCMLHPLIGCWVLSLDRRGLRKLQSGEHFSPEHLENWLCQMPDRMWMIDRNLCVLMAVARTGRSNGKVRKKGSKL